MGGNEEFRSLKFVYFLRLFWPITRENVAWHFSNQTIPSVHYFR